jgi:signal transduction histidine kinase/ActR/RegA family two-component response regulator
MTRLLTVRIDRDEDVVGARQRARQVSAALGLGAQDQIRLATAVSEIARNVRRYAGTGTAEFALDAAAGELVVTLADRGPGIPDLASVLDGRYRSRTGMGLGIIGTRRIVDGFDIVSGPGDGTRVVLRKRLPQRRSRPDAADLRGLAERLDRETPPRPVDEVVQQNHELLAALEELEQRREELARLNAELQDTNRGVVALYAELDETAERLRRADATKSKFLSNMTHEFQTPLNSILALTRLLLERADGDLTHEQEKQVRYIRQATEDLAELVHDLLDIAKVEAGKVTVRPASFNVQDLFGALRGLMRPLQTNEDVTLSFEAAEPLPALFTDEGKVSQILRNYISNALKFTERGSVLVRASAGPAGDIVFEVTDTGIGIGIEDQERLFQEFGQVPNPLQARVRGTGLGLSLSKRLAELLGGSVGVRSVPGEGSTFWLLLPAVAPGFRRPSTDASPAAETTGRQAPVALVVDDELTARYVLRRCLTSVGLHVVEASDGHTALTRAAAEHPDVIFLDLRMPDMGGGEVLARLKRNPATATIPVVIATSQIVADAERERLGAHAVAVLGKATIGSANGDDEIRRALRAANVATS